jgi:hypothetical protein
VLGHRSAVASVKEHGSMLQTLSTGKKSPVRASDIVVLVVHL